MDEVWGVLQRDVVGRGEGKEEDGDLSEWVTICLFVSFSYCNNFD